MQRNGNAEQIKKRALKAAFTLALLLAAGGLYYLEIIYVGYGIRCPFEKLTGLSCPGCGVTGMALSIMRGNLAAAWQCNQLTFALIPFYAIFGIQLIAKYIRTGSMRLSRNQSAVLWIIIACYLVFGIWRNL